MQAEAYAPARDIIYPFIFFESMAASMLRFY